MSKAITLRAHFDGDRIVLDDPDSVKLKPNAKLLVTVLPESESGQQPDDNRSERQAWLQLSVDGLRRAYSDDEVEYSLDLIKEPNPEYEGR